MQKPNGSEVHTKYIYGAQGDMAAQITRDSGSVTLASLNVNTEYAMAGFYDSGSLHGLALSIYYTSKKHFHDVRTPLNFYLFIIFCAGLIIVYFKFNVFVPAANKRNNLYKNRYKNHKILAPSAIMTLIVFSSAFVFNGCTGTGDANVDPAPWGDITPGSGSPSLDAALPGADYNDTITNGQPIEGAYFIHPDHLGSVALVTDVSGTVVSEIAYKPYGEVLRKDASGNPASTGPDFLRHKYTGQEDDPETGLMYYDARYYDPGIGRFITADSMYDSGAGTQGFNRYMYTGGNPVNYRDPSGHFIVGLAIAFLVGGAINMAVTAIQNGGCTATECLNAFMKGAIIAAFVYIAIATIGVMSGAEGFAGAETGTGGLQKYKYVTKNGATTLVKDGTMAASSSGASTTGNATLTPVMKFSISVSVTLPPIAVGGTGRDSCGYACQRNKENAYRAMNDPNYQRGVPDWYVDAYSSLIITLFTWPVSTVYNMFKGASVSVKAAQSTVQKLSKLEKTWSRLFNKMPKAAQERLRKALTTKLDPKSSNKAIAESNKEIQKINDLYFKKGTKTHSGLDDFWDLAD